jgi:guanylate cyclase soluble subunit alpha
VCVSVCVLDTKLRKIDGLDSAHPQGLEFKGQMLYCHESDCLLFLASPLVDGLEALTSRGLFISDIPIHDATRDIVLVGEQARAQVGFSFCFFCFLF